LDELRVALEAEGAAAGWGDALRGPGGAVEDAGGGVADGVQAGEAVANLGEELLLGVVFGAGGEDEVDDDAMPLRDAGDADTGGVQVRGDGDALDEAQLDDIAGDGGIVAVAEGFADGGFGERGHGASSGARRGTERGL